jgi:hypothetical protein
MRRLISHAIVTMLFFSLAAPVVAEPNKIEAAIQAEQGTSIRQQGLTIHELDKELIRLKTKEQAVGGQILTQEQALDRQKAVLQERTESAGRVLRSYYMGQRDRLWLLMFQMNSLSEALLALDYLQAIVSNDFRMLEKYKQALSERKQLLADLEAQQTELTRVISEHEQQRARLVAAQEELDRQLALLTEQRRKEELAQIEMLKTAWEREGIPLFEEVLGSLAAAMVDLPVLLSDESLLKVKGANVEIQITDSHFNTFLRERNALFEQFQFSFRPDGMKVTGAVEDKKASFQGKYVLQSEPTNVLLFQIDTITFNGYELPDTTRNDLQSQYDLAFEPGRLFAGLKVSDLANEEGRMRVQLAFDGFPLAFGQ